MVKALRNARVFVLGRISLILNEGRPCTNAENNPSVEVVLTVYDYDPQKLFTIPKANLHY